MKISASKRLAFKFSLLLALIIMLLSLLLLFASWYRERLKMGGELKRAAEQIERGVQDVPYYIMFSMYTVDTRDVIETNDPFLPILPLTNGAIKRHREAGYFTDGDLDVLYCAVMFENGTKPYVVQAAMNIERDNALRQMNGLPLAALVALLPLLAASYFAAYIITRGTMRPVEQMTKSARQIGIENLDMRLPLTGRGDELDVLAQTFNELFARLGADFDRERRFTSDVSHELKTPLAVILGHANLIRRWGKDDKEQLEKSLQMLIAEVHSMEAIIENLLELSRFECGGVKIAMSDVSVQELFGRLINDTAAWTKASICAKCNRAYIVRADMEMLYQACTIIVSNSVKFGGNDVRIFLDAAICGSSARIIIEDDGPGIPKDVLPHIFERFFRGEPSHNRASGSFGLGLSIVHSIMKSMNGSVKAESPVSKGRGTRLILTLPAPPVI